MAGSDTSPSPPQSAAEWSGDAYPERITIDDVIVVVEDIQDCGAESLVLVPG
jgi:hypothetical protein